MYTIYTICTAYPSDLDKMNVMIFMNQLPMNGISTHSSVILTKP